MNLNFENACLACYPTRKKKPSSVLSWCGVGEEAASGWQRQGRASKLQVYAPAYHVVGKERVKERETETERQQQTEGGRGGSWQHADACG